jgi:hydrogenase-4 component E
MKYDPQHILISFLILTNLFMISTSRLRAPISIVALQGIFLGLFPYFLHWETFSPHTIILSALGIAIKGIAIPLLLLRAVRGVAVERELKPYIGYTLSIALCIIMTGISFWIGRSIHSSSLFPSPSMISLAICISLTGLFLIVTRAQALTQIIGYLVLENGIFTFGISLPAQQSVLVEMGVLLDLLVGVFIMGIVLYHINREFDSISTKSLETLKQ